MGETVTGREKHAGRQRPRETRGEGATGRQEDHAFRCEWAPSWERGIQAGRWALVRRAPGREW